MKKIYEKKRTNYRYTRYKNAAHLRGIEFNISPELFWKIKNSKCFYCDNNPPNGIDRLFSDKPYEYTNIVPCCKRCNYAKGTVGFDKFIEWIRLVYKNTNSKF